MSVFIPKNLDCDHLLMDIGVTQRKNRYRDVCLYIIGTITKIEANYRNEYGYGVFVPRLSAKDLNKMIGSGYKGYLDDLEAAGVLIRGRTYEPGKECKSVTLSEEYRTAPLVKVEISDLALNRQYKKYRHHKRRAETRALYEHKDLVSFLRSEEMEIDEAAAKEWVYEYTNVIEQKIRASTVNEKNKRRLLNNLTVVQNQNLEHINRLLSRDIEHRGFDTFGFRFHTALTNLKSELRHFITYGGASLSLSDVRNSQPYFEQALANGLQCPGCTHEEVDAFAAWLQSGPQSVRKRQEKVRKTKVRNREGSPDVESIMLYDLRETLTHAGFQGNCNHTAFTQLVLSGSIYSELSNHFQQRFLRGNYDPFSPENVKGTVLWLMYHNPVARERFKTPFYDPIFEFQNMFPKDFQLMELIKSGNYRRLPMILQRIESFVMFQLIRKRISQELPEAPISFIHDCVMTSEIYQQEIGNIIASECERIVGAPPQLKVEPLKPAAAWGSLDKLREKDPNIFVADLLEKKKQERRKLQIRDGR